MPLSPVMRAVVLKSAILARSEDVQHRRALGEDRSNWFSFADLLPERAVLAPERSRSSALRSTSTTSSGLKGLLDVVVGARLHRLEGEVDVAVGAHHDDRRRVLLGLERGQQVEAAHLGHAHVGEDDVGAERVDQRERRFAAVGDLDLVAVCFSSVRSTSRMFSSSSTTRTRRMVRNLFTVNVRRTRVNRESIALASVARNRSSTVRLRRVSSGMRTGLDRLGDHAAARGRAPRRAGGARSLTRRRSTGGSSTRAACSTRSARASRRASARSTATAARRRT